MHFRQDWVVGCITITRIIRGRSKKVGLPAGTVVYVGEKKSGEVKIKIIDYDEAHFEEKEAKDVEECFPFKDKPPVTWINIDGVHRVDIIEKLGKYFNLHPLALEDIANTGQRPKIEDFVDYVLMVLKCSTMTKKRVRQRQNRLVLFWARIG
jgi:magnesium transporter